jgi:tRNA threonylcarbamoyladenosine biosynthesis protein TsaB
VILALDASTDVGTVAVCDASGRVVADRAVALKDRDHEWFLPAVLDALAAAGVATAGVARVVCGAGPGGFTSLRIAAATAKGFAHALGVPLAAVPSLALAVAAAPLGPGRYVATLDALRGERYAATWARDARGAVTPVAPTALVAAESVAAFAAAHRAMLLPDDARPHARGIAAWLAHGTPLDAVDLASWEPAYGRLAEAQVRWEAAHGKPLGAA